MSAAAPAPTAKFSDADLKTAGKVALGALAVGAVAAGAYYLYKRSTKAKADPADGKAATAKGKASDKPAPWPSANHVSASGVVDAVALGSGAKFPTLGFGTLCSAGDTPAQVATAVRHALATGFRHIDCASAYRNEKQIGEVLAELVVPDSGKAASVAATIKRKDLFVTSKLWCDAWDDVRGACLTTLANLQVEYLDLYLVHWPFENCPPSAEVKSGAQPPPAHIGYSADRYLHVWRQMEKLVDDGLVRAIGVSNLTVAKLQPLLREARIRPAVNQIETHPYLAQPSLVSFCKAQGIVVAAYFVIGSARRAAFMRADSDPVLLDDPAVVAVAAECKATPAQVLIAWALARGTVPLVKALSPARIQENWNAYGVALTAAQLKRLDALDRDFRYLKADVFAWPVTTPWRALWDHEHVAKSD